MAHILVVEDDRGVGEFVQAALEDHGHEVSLVANGIEALAFVHEQLIDLIISDVMMPVMDGLTLCRELHADPHYRTIPVVLMSASVVPISQADSPYTAFIEKPIDIFRLYKILDGLILPRHLLR